MSKAKKLDLTLSELIKITDAINKNTLANRTKSKDEKITTDIFIKQFGINRKDFAETIKDTNIHYNKSDFQYIVQYSAFDDMEASNNNSDTLVVPDKNNKGETKVASKKNNNSETKVVKVEKLETNVAIVEFENMKNELIDMLEWYKVQRKKENIIDIELPVISIDKEKLTEVATTRGFKIYPKVIAEFKEFCKQNSQYNMQDLMAMSLIEYMKKYKK